MASWLGLRPIWSTRQAVDFVGEDHFTFTVSDGNATATATISITVNAVNDAPIAVDQHVSSDEDQATSIILSGNDVDSDLLTYMVVAQPLRGTTERQRAEPALHTCGELRWQR